MSCCTIFPPTTASIKIITCFKYKNLKNNHLSFRHINQSPPTIAFEQVVPAPLMGVVAPSSQVWNTGLKLEPAQYYHVSAVSGKGKSTFVSILYGLRSDYQGQVLLQGKNIRSFTLDDWANYRQACFSIVFQDLRLFLNYTGWENMLVKADLYGKPDKEKITRMAEALGVLPLLDKKCGLLSYGERQRMAIIRALVPPFQWLLLDEPFSHLDQSNIQRASQLIAEECQARQAGLVLTSLGGDNLFDYHQKVLL
ncbi:MAG: ATP-binding cassette domain-containing protein [Bacteroidota bacterium]